MIEDPMSNELTFSNDPIVKNPLYTEALAALIDYICSPIASEVRPLLKALSYQAKARLQEAAGEDAIILLESEAEWRLDVVAEEVSKNRP